MRVTAYHYFFPENRPFVVEFVWLGLHAIQLGFHIDLAALNVEVHVPFCFVRIGKASECIDEE